MDKHIKALLKLAKDLNCSNITWSLGASMLLYFNDFDVSVDDIDIVVDIDDYPKLMNLLKNYQYEYMEPNKLYRTEHFFSLVVNGVDVDIMLGFKVVNEDEVYEFPFNKSEIERTIEIGNEPIHLGKVSEWLKAYQKMGRTDKVKIIETKKRDTFLIN